MWLFVDVLVFDWSLDREVARQRHKSGDNDDACVRQQIAHHISKCESSRLVLEGS
jgi:hypothetical protein